MSIFPSFGLARSLIFAFRVRWSSFSCRAARISMIPVFLIKSGKSNGGFSIPRFPCKYWKTKQYYFTSEGESNENLKSEKRHAAVGSTSHQHGLLDPTPNEALISPATIQRITYPLYRTVYPVTGTRRCSWLRHCATNRKVAGSIPDGVAGIFHWHNPSGHNMALGLTQPLTEMSSRNIFLG